MATKTNYIGMILRKLNKKAHTALKNGKILFLWYISLYTFKIRVFHFPELTVGQFENKASSLKSFLCYQQSHYREVPR